MDFNLQPHRPYAGPSVTLSVKKRYLPLLGKGAALIKRSRMVSLRKQCETVVITNLGCQLDNLSILIQSGFDQRVSAVHKGLF